MLHNIVLFKFTKSPNIKILQLWKINLGEL